MNPAELKNRSKSFMPASKWFRIEKACGYTIREIPDSFFTPWNHFIANSMKRIFLPNHPLTSPEFIESFNIPGFKVNDIHSMKEGLEQWESNAINDLGKKAQRKIIFRTSKPNSSDPDQLELTESNYVNGSIATRRVLVNYDFLGEGMVSLTDERVIISPQDTPVNDKNIDLKRIVYNWDLSTQEPSIAFSEEIEISDFELSQFPRGGLLEDLELQRILKKPNHFIPLSNDLKSSNQYLVNNIPPDYSIFPSAIIR